METSEKGDQQQQQQVSIALEDQHEKRMSSSSESSASDVPVKKSNYQPPHKPTSNMDTMAHFLKGNIGTGIFSFPSAFKQSGIWVGTILLPIMAVICTHCMHILVEAAGVMKEREGDFSVSYADVAQEAFAGGPEKYRKFSVAARKTINIFLCVTQIGVCCVYLVFVSTNLKAVIDFYVDAEYQYDVRIYMCILTVPLIFLNWIRNLKYLAPISLVANVLQSASIIVVFYYIFRDGLPPMSERPFFGSWAGLPLYFGTAVFAFEGIPLVLPLQKEMKTPKDFEGWTGILNTGMVIVTCIYLAMGFYGYLKYGSEILGSITLNLPEGDVLAQCVKILLALAICGNYAVAFYVPMPIMWPSVSKYFARVIPSELWGELTFRTCMVLVTLLFGVAIPKVDLFISLVGAVGSTFLALIFPPVLELVTYWPKVSKLTITKDVLIFLFGLLGFATGTYASILAIVEEFS